MDDKTPSDPQTTAEDKPAEDTPALDKPAKVETPPPPVAQSRDAGVPEGMMPAAPRRGQRAAEAGGYVRVRLPNKYKGEIFAVADQILGGSRLRIVCEDGESRLGRIPGKLRRRMWIREGDLLIVAPWEFQTSKADVRFRYTATQSSYLSRQGKVPDSIDIF